MKIGKKSYIVVFSVLVFVTGIALYSELGLNYPNNYGTDVPNYTVNEQGQTYGNGPFPAGTEQEPELIKAEGENGVIGYVKSSDLVPQVSSPEEANSYMKSIENVDYISIPLYKSDGKTVIGEFRLGN
jgi:hypothetical protein